MKTLIVTILIATVLIFLVACSTPKTSSTETSVLRDITEKHLAQPDANEIYGLYDLSQNPLNGAVFHFKNLSDVSYNYDKEAKIEAQNLWSSNELERTKEIKGFKNSMDEIIVNSSLYLPIARELNHISQSKADKKYLLIYSDLMENTIDVSFYNKKIVAQLQTNPEAIRKYFEQLQALQNLNGIEVYLIYLPIDSESDKIFTIVSAFYKKLLEDKGAKVNISANINF